MADKFVVQAGLAPVAVRLPVSNQENQIITNAGSVPVVLESVPNYVLSATGSAAAVTPGISFPPGSEMKLLKNSGAIYAQTTQLGSVVSSPAVPATTVNATNNTGAPVAVTIGGSGVVTLVSVGGVTVLTGANLTGSVVAVPAGATIALTYASGTPTWVWNSGQPCSLNVSAGVQPT